MRPNNKKNKYKGQYQVYFPKDIFAKPSLDHSVHLINSVVDGLDISPILSQ